MTLPHLFGPLMLPPFPPMCFIIHIKINCEYVAGFEIKVQRRLSNAQNNKVKGHHCHAEIPLNYCNVKNTRQFLF